MCVGVYSAVWLQCDVVPSHYVKVLRRRLSPPDVCGVLFASKS